MTKLAKKLLECMKEKEIGIKGTAELTGISRNRIRQILHGDLDISIDEAAKLQTAFGIDTLERASLCGKERRKNENAEPFRFSDIDEKDINHPARYGGDTEYECIKVLKAWLNKDEYRGFLKGNAIKYLCRLGKKDETVKEIQKAKWYLDKLEDSYRETK